MRRPVALAFFSLVALLWALKRDPAAADPSSTTVGITLNPIAGGYHESFNDTIALPPIPVPFLEASHRFSNFEITAYGLPPTVPIPYTDAIQSTAALRLTILDATFRVWDKRGRFGIGAGETIYNQTTHYDVAVDVPDTDEIQYSRVVGAHYELIARTPLHGGTLEASLRYAPVLLGTQTTTYGNGAPTHFDPERGEQIDTTVRYVHRAGPRGETVAGVRYVNYTAAYDVPARPLSDRNCGLLVTFGYLWKLGR
jgi:hypothetical protein